MDFLKNMRGRYGRGADLEKQVRAYRTVFAGPHAIEFVLPDLAEFCGAVEPSPANGDPFAQGRAAGRRDVWLRVQRHLNLTDAELFSVLKGDGIVRRDQETSIARVV